MNKNEKDIVIGVVHDWNDKSRPNMFSEDMRRDQIRLEVAELLTNSLNNFTNVKAQTISFEELKKNPRSIDGSVNIAYGEHGRFHLSTVPSFLDCFGIPNFGADPLQMLLTRNKQHTKLVAKSLGIKTPQSIYLDKHSIGMIDDLDDFESRKSIIKPNESASGLGLKNKIYKSLPEIKARVELLIQAYPEGVLIEDFIPGQEVTVAVLSDKKNVEAFPYIQRNQDSSALSNNYMNSFEENMAAYEKEEKKWFKLDEYVSKEQCDLATKWSIKIAETIGIAGYVRTDFRLAENGDLYFLEVNGQAGIGLKGSVVISIGRDYFNDRHGFIKRIACYAHSYLSTEISRSQSSKQEERWSNS